MEILDPPRDSPWANRRLIPAWVGQPWWDRPADSWDEVTLWISCRDALRLSSAPLRVQAHLCADEVLQLPASHPPPVQWTTSVSQSAPGFWVERHRVCGAPDSPDSLQSLSLSRMKPSFLYFFLLNVSGDPPFTFEALSANPSPSSPKPRSLVRLLLHASLPLLLPSVFSLFSLPSTQSTSRRAGSSPCAVPSLLRRGVTCTGDAPRSQAPQLQTQTLTSPLNRSGAKRPPTWSDMPCLMDRQREAKNRGGNERKGRTEKMMVESRGQKCGGESSHWGKSSTLSWA